MNKKQTTNLILLLCILFSFKGITQTNLQIGDKQMLLGMPHLAMESYMKAYQNHEGNSELPLKIAKCYAALGNPLAAINWYNKVAVANPNQETFRLDFGKELMKVARYGDAQKEFERFAAINKDLAKYYMDKCAFAVDLSAQAPTYAQPSIFNSKFSEVAPRVIKGFLVFTSFDTKNFSQHNNVSNSNHILVKNQLGTKKIDLLVSELQTKSNAGCLSCAKTGLCVFVKNDKVNGSILPNLLPEGSIFFTYYDGLKYQDERSFEFNEIGVANLDPYLNPEGDVLYFASNRKGGQGGFDLYVSRFNGLSWSKPENLGPQVNTPGDELAPSIHQNDLYFASNFHLGLGGFDLFRSSSTVTSGFSQPVNLGNGVNSSGDDLYPYFDPKSNVLYFSSNRIGGRGGFDIYTVVDPKGSEVQIAAVSNTSEVPQAVLIEDNFNVPTLVSEKKSTLETYPSPTVVSQKQITILEKQPVVQANEEAEVVESSSLQPKAYELPILNREAKSMNNFISLEGARRVAFEEIFTSKMGVFFIQLASFSNPNIGMARYQSLLKHGNVYKVNVNGLIKIRLGYFQERYQAEAVLQEVKASGFSDAFIILDFLDASGLELALSKHDKITEPLANERIPGNFEYKTNSKNYDLSYKVRLASYEDPIWFDNKKVSDIGKIEQWTKGGWTIFVLGGFNNMEEANAAKIKAINRGFMDAEVVIDNGGILERIKSN